MEQPDIKDLENEIHELALNLHDSFEYENELFKMSILASTNLTLAMQKHNNIELKLNKAREQTLKILERYINALDSLKSQKE